MTSLLTDTCPNVHPFSKVLLFFAFCFWVGQFVRLVKSTREMRLMYEFYTHALDIPNDDIQTTPWPVVVKRITDLSQRHPLPTMPTLSAHDITNRLMRKDNYLVAMFNKDIFDLRAKLSGTDNALPPFLTQILEWNLLFCVMGYVFDNNGHIKLDFLRRSNRERLVNGLRARILATALLNFILAPFISVFLILYFFFRYGEEYYRNPGNLNTRRYSPLARWKLREFNELPHLFQARINASHSKAMLYLSQFPAQKMSIIIRFMTFIIGSFAGVLVLISLIYPDTLTHLEITSERTPLFFIGVLGSVLAVSRSMSASSDPDAEKCDPSLLMRDTIKDTHYYPEHWVDRLHTVAVRTEFSAMFQYRPILYAYEFASVLLTPLILWKGIAECSLRIVDFFRDFTVHVDNVGYVCSFAVFDFTRNGNAKYGAPTQATSDYYVSQQGKMEKSFVHFKATYPEWEPAISGSTYLNQLTNLRGTRQRAPGTVPFGVNSVLDIVDGNERRSQNAHLRLRQSQKHRYQPPHEYLLNTNIPQTRDSTGLTPLPTPTDLLDVLASPNSPFHPTTRQLVNDPAMNLDNQQHDKEFDDNDTASSLSDPDMVLEPDRHPSTPIGTTTTNTTPATTATDALLQTHETLISPTPATEASLFGMLDAVPHILHFLHAIWTYTLTSD